MLKSVAKAASKTNIPTFIISTGIGVTIPAKV